MEEFAGSCEICGKESNSRCTNCRNVVYCSKEHQKRDWKAHKANCWPFAVADSQVFGRHLVASRDIAQGTLVLKETALLSGPNGKAGDFLLCLGCCGIVAQDDAAPSLCPLCRWPLHPSCAQSPLHAAYECPLLRARRMTPFSPPVETNIYDKLLLLRGCLLKLHDPSKWSLLSSLQGHEDARRDSPLLSSMLPFIRDRAGLSPLVISDEEIDHVLGVILVNAYVTDDNLSASPEFVAGSFVFYRGSFPAHSCVPNCKWVIVRGTLHLMAMRDITKGVPLSHCYAWGGAGTLERQRHLKKTKFFTCTCCRCEDPAELGSYYSGVRCPECDDFDGKGYLLPLEPLKEGSLWRCRDEGCREEKEEAWVIGVISGLREEQTKLVENEEYGNLAALGKLEGLRERALERLHKNHFVVHEIEQEILLRASTILAQGEGRGLERVVRLGVAQKMVELARKAEGLINIIAKGSSTHLGRQLYYLQQGLGILLLDQIQSGGSGPALLSEAQEWRRLRAQGHAILATESKGREEWVLGQALIDKEPGDHTHSK